ncbi:MAG: DMT family transporter [Steroidobacteraceae bacterium]
MDCQPSQAAAAPEYRFGEPVAIGLYILMFSIWGSSFFFTAIALRGFNVMSLAALRMSLAALALGVLVRIFRLPLPRESRVWRHLLVLGVFNIGVPYLLLIWAQLYVPSSAASVLSATTPLFVFLFSWLIARTETFGALRALGLLLAFAGVVLLNSGKHAAAGGEGIWPLVIVLSSVFFAAGNVYTRRFLTHIHPLVLAFLQIGIGALCLLAAALFAGQLSLGRPLLLPWLALMELAFAGSALTYVLFFHFIGRWGSTTTSLNTYFQPIVGLSLGVLVLREAITPLGWIALGVILLGVALFGLGTVRRRPAAPLKNLVRAPCES